MDDLMINVSLKSYNEMKDKLIQQSKIIEQKENDKMKLIEMVKDLQDQIKELKK